MLAIWILYQQTFLGVTLSAMSYTFKLFPVLLLSVTILLTLSLTAVSGCPEECQCVGTIIKCTALPPNTDIIRDIIPKLNPNVTELDFSENTLSRFQAVTLIRFKLLRVLVLSENKLSDLPKNLSIALPSLRELYLRGNYLLKSFSRESLEAAFLLEKLDVRDSGINELASGVFYNNSRLVHLDLQYNKLKEFDSGAFIGLRYLKLLHLDHNQIIELSTELLWPLRHLQKFTVSSNRIRKVPHSLFHSPHLKVINFKNNEISHLEPASFQGLANVSVIYLQHNNIETFPPQIFKGSNINKAVHLNHNPLRCDCYIVSFELRWLRLDDKIKGRCQKPTKLKGVRISTLTRKQLACTSCDFNQCKNNATCAIEADYYVCKCAPGFEGQFCETAKEKKYKKDWEWIVTLVVCLFVVFIGVVFFVWYYRKRKGIQGFCSQRQCCCCCFITVVIVVLGIFFMFRIISYMYEHS